MDENTKNNRETSAPMLECGIHSAIERKQYKEALRDVEQKYHAFLDVIDEGFILGEMVRDAQGKAVDYRILEVNRAFEMHTGFTAAEVAGRPRSEIHLSRDERMLEALDHVVETGQPYRWEQYHVGLDRWLNTGIFPFGGDRFVGLFHNITGRKRAEENLAILSEISRELIGLGSLAEMMERLGEKIGQYFGVVWYIFGELTGDLETLMVRYEWKTKDAPSLGGPYRMRDFLSDEQLERCRSGELCIVSDTQTGPQVRCEQYAAHGIRSFIIIPLIRDGECRCQISIFDNKPRQWRDDEVSLLQDIANRIWMRLERARVEAALAESEERYRVLVQYAPAGIYEVDFRSKRFTSVNDAMCRVTGYTREELLHMGPFEILDEASRQLFLARIKQWLSGEKPDQNVEYRVLTRDGREIFAVLNVTFTKDENGQPLGATVIAHDITERKRAENQLKEQSAVIQEYSRKLEQSNQELQSFAFIASHDLQEPLRKIETFGHLLMKSTGPSLAEQDHDYLERMQNAAQRMSKMIQDLLALSRVTTRAEPFETVDLNQVAKSVVDDLTVLLRQTGGQVDLQPLPTLQADPTQMHQLLLNLIGNGLKFHQADVPPLVHVYSRLLSDQQVEINIEDNGIGFSMEQAGQLFQPFHRLHGRNEYEGTGIGLSICRKIAERHGGTITAKSEPGQGSTFIVQLPINP